MTVLPDSQLWKEIKNQRLSCLKNVIGFVLTQMYVVTQVENFGDNNGIGKKKKERHHLISIRNRFGFYFRFNERLHFLLKLKKGLHTHLPTIMSSLSLLFGRHRIQRSRVNILLAPLNTDVRVLMSAASITANMRPRTPVRKHFQLKHPNLYIH